MERKIGEIFDYKGIKLKVVKDEGICFGCFFQDICETGKLHCRSLTGICWGPVRRDRTPVIFKDVEKIAFEKQRERERKRIKFNFK